MPSASPLGNSVQYLKGVGPARAADLARLGIQTIADLLFTFPRDISDRSSFTTIADAGEGKEAAFLVRPLDCTEKKARGGRLKITTVRFTDDTGVLEAVWFNSPWIADALAQSTVMLFGKVKSAYGHLRMEHPQYEVLGEGGADEGLNIGRIVPFYPCTGKLTQSIWRKIMRNALDNHLCDIHEILPRELVEAHQLLPRQQALESMHFPSEAGIREQANARLIYEECLLMQLGILLARRRQRTALPGRRFTIGRQLDHRIRRLFPFRLTAAQNRCIEEIAGDMKSSMPLHRLLQGDVGSGKTVVAMYAMLAAVANSTQVCIMAPTSLLADQHYRTTLTFLENSERQRVRVALLTGGTQ